MNTNDLCTIEEHEQGYSAHMSNFGIIIMENNKIFMEVSDETELHEVLNIK